MMPLYYNQLKYASVPYPAPGYEKATVKSSGCGPTSLAMIVEGLTGESFPPPDAAAFAIACGARVSGGTNMGKLSQAGAEKFGLTLSRTSDEASLIAALKGGSWAIANVGGNRDGYTGLFSNGGHYVVCRGLCADGRIIVWDPGYYSGKFNVAGRKGKVEVCGNDCYVSAENLALDAANRNPRY
jgi:hypothetical protein